MAANAITIPGAEEIEFYFSNGTYADAQAMPILKSKVVNELGKLFIKDGVGNLCKLMCDASGSSNTPASRVFFSDSEGAASSDSVLIYDSINKKLGIGISPAIGAKLHLHQASSANALIKLTNTTTGSGEHDGLNIGVVGDSYVIRTQYNRPIVIETENPSEPGQYLEIAKFQKTGSVSNTILNSDLKVNTIVAKSTAASVFLTHEENTIKTRTAAQVRADIGAAAISHSHAWSEISDKPSVFAPAAHTHAIADVTNLQTALDGKQPLDSDLTTIAALTHSNRHVLISNGTNWTRRALEEADLPSLSSAKLPSNIVYTDNTQTISGAKTFSANATFAGSIIGSGAAGLRIVNNTTDGSDTKTLLLSGGCSYESTRGATIALRGNESTDGYGNLELIAGDGNGTITGAVRVNPRMYFGTRPANDHRWTLALDQHNTLYGLPSTALNIMHNLYHDGSNWRYRYGSTNSGGVITTLAHNQFSVQVASNSIADGIATLTPAIYTNLSGNTAFGKNTFVGGNRLEVEGNTLVNGKLKTNKLNTGAFVRKTLSLNYTEINLDNETTWNFRIKTTLHPSPAIFFNNAQEGDEVWVFNEYDSLPIVVMVKFSSDYEGITVSPNNGLILKCFGKTNYGGAYYPAFVYGFIYSTVHWELEP
jgi:hypothetical protein